MGHTPSTKGALLPDENAVTESTWQTHVYGSAPPDFGPARQREWKRVRSAVYRRDNYTCQRCLDRKNAVELGAHHIRPRAEGGSDTLPNLITLCEPCHDYVELEGLTSVSAIAGSYEDPFSKYIFNEPLPGRGEWRSWVYGGAKIRHAGT